MKKYSVAAVITILITAVIVCMTSCEDEGVKLILGNSETGKIIKSFEVSEGDEFSVEFIHSVNQSPVKDVFVIRNKKIYADRTVYSAFGAGVQTEIDDGQILTFDEEGNMVVSGFNIEFPQVKYIVGTVSDHILEISDESISLRELCGKNAHIYFEIGGN